MSFHRSLPAAAVALAIASGPAFGEEGADALPKSPIYGKPFLERGGASLGGYIDLEFKADGNGSTFDQHRFVPFIYAEVSERVHVASEIEFEHGGFVAGSEETEGEIKIEFATMDLTAAEALNVRAGVILSPLGSLNIFHDAPMLDLTERPLVNRHIIPTTLSESGLGLFGTLYPSEASVLSYEAYAVNGFNENAVQGGVLNLRDARGSKSSDNNNGRALVGRLAFSPALGTDLGASVHTGTYDDGGDHNLTIAAFDARFTTGPVEILGEGALARAGFDQEAGLFSLAGAPQEEIESTAKAWGTYLEARWHLFPGAIASLPASVFTTVARLDYVDLDENTEGNDLGRFTLGLNFRITEETVIKNDILFDRARSSGSSEWGDTDQAYRLSLASYF